MELHKEEEEIKKVGKDKPVYKATNPSTVNVVFKQNRRFELQVDRETIVFEPHEEKTISIEIIKHPDFIMMKNYFAIKGE